MRWRDWQVAEKGLVLIGSDKLQGLIHDLVVGVSFSFSPANIPLQDNLFAIANQVGRIKRMGMDLIVVAVKNVEAVIFGYTRRVSTSTSPFTEPACRIPLLFEERSDGQLSGSQRRASIIRSDRRVSRMFTRH